MQPYQPDKLPLDMTAWNWGSLVPLVGQANRKLSYYDGVLSSIINPSLFLSPLETKEAVLSSKIEGTITTIDEVLKYEADIVPASINKQQDIQEVLNYRTAMRNAIGWIERQLPFNSALVCNIQKELMDSVRGENKFPGQFRKEQNWIGKPRESIELATYIPPEPLSVGKHMSNLVDYMQLDDQDPILQTAIIHAQFELIHPFLDGNGRTGRILIPLFLWHKKVIKAPVFYISEYLEANRNQYYQCLRSISQDGDWEGWVRFFLGAVTIQAECNAQKANQVLLLYHQMKSRIRMTSNSPYTVQILDTMFANPIIDSTSFIKQSGLNSQTGRRIVNKLKDEQILSTLQASAGRRPEILIFKELMEIL